jgi:uncharacterized damage-inducible protein DinB
MKELLQLYASYNKWANEKLIAFIQSLDDKTLNQELPSSFKTIPLTLLHMLDAETIWWQRLNLNEPIVSSTGFKGTTTDLKVALLNQNQRWKNWVNNADPAELTHILSYRNTKLEQFNQPVYEILLHIFNHGTYHRGQIVNLLRQLGTEKIPATDFIVWSRSRK